MRKKSFRLPLYLGFFGILLIIFAQIANFFIIEPFVYCYIAMLWYGYVLVIDSTVYALKQNSYIINRPKKFVVFIILSTIFWLIFEYYNRFLKGWYYIGIETNFCIPCYFAISTILPAVFETMELIRALRIFQKVKMGKVKINKSLLYLSIFLGLMMIILPFLYHSPFMWTLVWLGFILLLDPINYLFHEESLISKIKAGKISVVLSLFFAGYICGFIWEFWNYWAHTKWYYSIPILSEVKIFEIPFLGFFAYGFFAWELYTMYYFVKLLIPKNLETKLELR